MTYKEARALGLCGVCKTRQASEGKTSCQSCRDYRIRMLQGLHVPPEEREAWRAQFEQKRRAHIRRWQKEHPEKVREFGKNDRRKVREKVFYHYGRSCICCGEDRFEFLTIDHVDGGGSQHRQQIKNDLYRWLIKNNYPEGFQTLCYNCNCAKKDRVLCPHKMDGDYVWFRTVNVAWEAA